MVVKAPDCYEGIPKNPCSGNHMPGGVVMSSHRSVQFFTILIAAFVAVTITGLSNAERILIEDVPYVVQRGHLD